MPVAGEWLWRVRHGDRDLSEGVATSLANAKQAAERAAAALG
jgi:hypothetical protein